MLSGVCSCVCIFCKRVSFFRCIFSLVYLRAHVFQYVQYFLACVFIFAHISFSVTIFFMFLFLQLHLCVLFCQCVRFCMLLCQCFFLCVFVYVFYSFLFIFCLCALLFPHWLLLAISTLHKQSVSFCRDWTLQGFEWVLVIQAAPSNVARVLCWVSCICMLACCRCLSAPRFLCIILFFGVLFEFFQVYRPARPECPASLLGPDQDRP